MMRHRHPHHGAAFLAELDVKPTAEAVGDYVQCGDGGVAISVLEAAEVGRLQTACRSKFGLGHARVFACLNDLAHNFTLNCLRVPLLLELNILK